MYIKQYAIIYDVNPGKDGTPVNKQTTRTLNEIKKIEKFKEDFADLIAEENVNLNETE